MKIIGNSYVIHPITKYYFPSTSVCNRFLKITMHQPSNHLSPTCLQDKRPVNCELGSGPWRFEMTELSLKKPLTMRHSLWLIVKSMNDILLTWSWWALVFRYSKSFRRFAKAFTLISKMVKNKRPDFIFILFFNFSSLTLSLILRDRKAILLYKLTEFFWPNRPMWFYSSECDVHSSWHLSLEKIEDSPKTGFKQLPKSWILENPSSPWMTSRQVSILLSFIIDLYHHKTIFLK